MPKIQFSDVTPPERRSIRDVPIPNSGRRKVPIVIKPEKEQPPKPEPVPEIPEKKANNPYEYYYPKYSKIKNGPEQQGGGYDKSKNRRFIFGGIALVAIVVFIVSMMTVLASATITIVPKNQDIDVDTKITAVSEIAEGAVRYEVIKLSESKTANVAATGEEAVELKASGKIVIYNNFSTESQRLIVRTRFENPEGLIYRIPESVVVPGKSVKNGVETPGSIEVEVFADEAGEKYNIKKSDFTIPGFKNEAIRYKNFYARSLTNMTGGFIGKRKTVSPTEKQAALQNIDAETNSNLLKELQTKVPDGLALLSDAIIYKSKELPPEEDGSSVTLGKEVTAYAIMLNMQDLSDKITKEYIASSSSWDNIKPEIKDFSLLKISGTPDNLEGGGKINLQVSGKAMVLADLDPNIIKQRLLGAPKNEAAKLINEFAGISSITAAIRPIWKQSFPENPSKIYVEIGAGK